MISTFYYVSPSKRLSVTCKTQHYSLRVKCRNIGSAAGTDNHSAAPSVGIVKLVISTPSSSKSFTFFAIPPA